MSSITPYDVSSFLDICGAVGMSAILVASVRDLLRARKR